MSANNEDQAALSSGSGNDDDCQKIKRYLLIPVDLYNIVIDITYALNFIRKNQNKRIQRSSGAETPFGALIVIVTILGAAVAYCRVIGRVSSSFASMIKFLIQDSTIIAIMLLVEGAYYPLRTIDVLNLLSSIIFGIGTLLFPLCGYCCCQGCHESVDGRAPKFLMVAVFFSIFFMVGIGCMVFYVGAVSILNVTNTGSGCIICYDDDDTPNLLFDLRPVEFLPWLGCAVVFFLGLYLWVFAWRDSGRLLEATKSQEEDEEKDPKAQQQNDTPRIRDQVVISSIKPRGTIAKVKAEPVIVQQEQAPAEEAHVVTTSDLDDYESTEMEVEC